MSADDRGDYFCFDLFLQKIAFDRSCKLPPKKKICMKFQSLFSEEEKSKETLSKCCPLEIQPSIFSGERMCTNTN